MTQELTPLTMDEVLHHCYNAMETLLNSNLTQAVKDKAEALEYDIYLNYKMGNVLGLAYKKGGFARGHRMVKGLVENYSMELNYVMLSHLSPLQRFQTVSHELAHLLDYELRGRSGHDAQWKTIHRCMGGDGEATAKNICAPNAKSKYKVVNLVKNQTYYMTNRKFKRYMHYFALNKGEWSWERLKTA